MLSEGKADGTGSESCLNRGSVESTRPVIN